jgi:serine/threonine protein kinase/lipopolysaccharide biosynthesis regulator YciM
MARSYSVGEEPVPGSGYRLTEFLGRGGFGEVWKAVGPGGTEVAIKMIPLGGMEGRKEFRALQLVKRIRHPNLVPTIAFWVRDAGGTTLDDAVVSQLNLRAPTVDENGFRATMAVSPSAGAQAVELIIAMGLGDISLFDRLQQCRAAGERGIPAEELLHYMDGAAAAIDYLNRPIHDLGSGPVAIQHCDIKPHNIMIVGGAAQLCDFGLARAIGAVRMTSAMAATIAYAAPECLQTGEPSAASDQYSLAITYYELRTSQLPYQDATYGVVMSAVMQGELDLSAASKAEQPVLRRATSLDPASRFPSASEMVRCLRAACEGRSDVPAATAAARRSGAGRLLTTALLLGLAAAAVFAAWRFWPSPPPAPEPPRKRDGVVEPAPLAVDTHVLEKPPSPPVALPTTEPSPAERAEPHLTQGTAHLTEGRYDEAVAALQLAAAANPGDARIFSRLGSAWFRKDQPEQAVDAFSKAIAIEPDAVDYVTRGRAYLDLNRHEDAYRDFSRAIQLDPKYAAAHFFRADGLLRQERLEEAVADCTQAIELGAQQEVDFPLADAYLFRGSALMARGRLDQAAADFSQAIGHREPTEAADDYRILAECHEAQEKTAAAEYDRQIADLLDAIHKQPADVASLRAAAMLLATCPLPEIRHGSHAVTLAQRACEVSGGKDATCLDSLAAAYAESGDFEEAVRREQEAVRLAPDDASRSQYQSRLEHYQAGKKYWSTPSTP